MFLSGDVLACRASPSTGHKRGLAFKRSGGNFALSYVLFDVEIVLKSRCLMEFKRIHATLLHSLSFVCYLS